MCDFKQFLSIRLLGLNSVAYTDIGVFNTLRFPAGSNDVFDNLVVRFYIVFTFLILYRVVHAVVLVLSPLCTQVILACEGRRLYRLKILIRALSLKTIRSAVHVNQ